MHACLVASVVSGCLRLYGSESTRLLWPWDSPGKNTGAGCHFLLQGSSLPRDQTRVSCIAGRFFIFWATLGAIIPNQKRKKKNENDVKYWHDKVSTIFCEMANKRLMSCTQKTSSIFMVVFFTCLTLHFFLTWVDEWIYPKHWTMIIIQEWD